MKLQDKGEVSGKIAIRQAALNKRHLFLRIAARRIDLPLTLYMMNEKESISDLLVKLDQDISVFEKQSLKEQLAVYINDLLLHNFDYLIHLLYRVDVSESKLKNLLRETPQTDAALIIADLMIQRQEEKRQSRASHKKTTDQDDEEKW